MIRFICDRCGKEFSEVDMVRVNANHYVKSCAGKVNLLTMEVCSDCFNGLGKLIFDYVKTKGENINE